MSLTRVTPEMPRAFDLPVLVALVPPAGASGELPVELIGVAAQMPRARDLRQVSFIDGKKTTVTFVLNGVDPDTDLAGLDLSPTPDFAGCIPADPCGPTVFGVQSSCGMTYDCGQPFVADVTPRVAVAGEKIVVHGRFPMPMNATFPGNAAAAIDSAEPTRIILTMPAGATAGSIQLTFPAGMLLTPPVRRLAFPPGLQPFFPHYEQTTYARVAQPMNIARTFHTATTHDGYVYVFGGQGMATPLTIVERALINADGTLHRFVIQSQGMTTPRAGHAQARIRDRVYLIGGSNGTGALDTIETTTINADHTLAAFTPLPGKLTEARHGATAVVIGRWLYVLGGVGQKSVERAPINADGTLGAFADTGLQLFQPRNGATAVVSGKTLYVLGGSSNATASGALASIEYAEIGADGDLTTLTAGVFNVLGTSLQAPRAFHTATVVGRILIIAGGENTTGRLAAASLALFDQNGMLGPFTDTVLLDQGRVGAAAFIAHNRLYLLGGSSTTLQGSFEWASIMNDATTIGAPTIIGATLPGARSDYCMVVSGDHVYLFGGRAGGRGADHAVVRIDGSLGPFADAGIALSTNNHDYCGAVVAGPFVYVVGGSSGMINNNTYERVPINDDGTIGAPNTPEARHGSLTGGFAIAAAGPTVYAFAGQYWNGVSMTTDAYNGYIRHPADGGDGSLGMPTAVTSAFGAVPVLTRGAVFKHRPWMIGGNVVGTLYFNWNPVTGVLDSPASAGPSLNSVRPQPALAYLGNRLWVLGGGAANNYEFLVVPATGLLTAGTQFAGAYFGANGVSGAHGLVLDNDLWLVGGAEVDVPNNKIRRIPIQ
jgi:hypothetical protein